ncbi:cytochrome P450, partial [Haematococcus lacustris]
MVACILQGTHNLYSEPQQFRPQRFLPGGEYDSWDEADRLFMFVPFIQARGVLTGLTGGMPEVATNAGLCQPKNWLVTGPPSLKPPPAAPVAFVSH